MILPEQIVALLPPDLNGILAKPGSTQGLKIVLGNHVC